MRESVNYLGGVTKGEIALGVPRASLFFAVYALETTAAALCVRVDARCYQWCSEGIGWLVVLQAIELFLVKNVSLVVTDRSDRPGQAAAAAANSNDSRRRWGYAASGGSGGPPSLRSIEVPTPTPTPPTPYRSVEGPLSNSTNQRGGQPAQRSVSLNHVV